MRALSGARRAWPILIVTILAVLLILVGPAFAAESGDSAVVQITVALPEEWSGLEFCLTTDIGLSAETYTVDENGRLTVSVPESSYYMLTLADASTEIPKLPQTAATSELVDASASNAGQPTTILLNLGSDWAGAVFRTFSDQKFTPAFIAVDSDGMLRINIDYDETCNIACLILTEEEFQALSADGTDGKARTFTASRFFAVVKPGVLVYLAGLGILVVVYSQIKKRRERTVGRAGSQAKNCPRFRPEKPQRDRDGPALRTAFPKRLQSSQKGEISIDIA